MDGKKILTVILAIILIIPVGRKWYDFLAYRFFDIGFVSSSPLNFEKLSDTEIKIVGYNSDLDKDFKIPSKILILPNIYTVTCIGGRAFYRCKI